MHQVVILALQLVQLTGPGGQEIDVNPDQVVSLREKRGNEHFAPGAKCVIHTADGKFVAVQEDCNTVQERLNQTNEE